MSSVIIYSGGMDSSVLLHLRRTDIVTAITFQYGSKHSIGIDFTKIYSCYNGGPIHCGKCGTCVERKEALAGFDTTEYMA